MSWESINVMIALHVSLNFDPVKELYDVRFIL